MWTIFYNLKATHWRRSKVADILQITFSDTFIVNIKPLHELRLTSYNEIDC